MEQKKNTQLEETIEEFLDVDVERTDSYIEPREINFANNLTFQQTFRQNRESTGGKILKNGEVIGYCDLSPINSYNHGGFFLLLADRKNKTYHYVDGDGNKSKRVFGKKSGPFYFGYARLEIIDEQVDPQLLETSPSKSVYTFAKTGKNGNLQLMKARFSSASFMDRCGLGRVRMLGENTYTYVTKTGYVLPYRFTRADECFRDGRAEVTFFGQRALICDNFEIVKDLGNGRYKVLTTLKDFIENPKRWEVTVQEGSADIVEQSDEEDAELD